MTNLWWADTYDELSITLYSHEHYELYVLPHILGEGNIKQDKCVLHCCTTDMTTRPVGQSIATAATLVLSTVWVVIVVTAFYIWQRRIGTSTFIVREDQSNFSLILFFRILFKSCWVSVLVCGLRILFISKCIDIQATFVCDCCYVCLSTYTFYINMCKFQFIINLSQK